MVMFNSILLDVWVYHPTVHGVSTVVNARIYIYTRTTLVEPAFYVQPKPKERHSPVNTHQYPSMDTDARNRKNEQKNKDAHEERAPANTFPIGLLCLETSLCGNKRHTRPGTSLARGSPALFEARVWPKTTTPAFFLSLLSTTTSTTSTAIGGTIGVHRSFLHLPFILPSLPLLSMWDTFRCS